MDIEREKKEEFIVIYVYGESISEREKGRNRGDPEAGLWVGLYHVGLYPKTVVHETA